jgi:hypothetical protein
LQLLDRGNNISNGRLLVDFKDFTKLLGDLAWGVLSVTSFPDIACGSVELMDQSLRTIQDDHFSVYQPALDVSALPRPKGVRKTMIRALIASSLFTFIFHAGFRVLNSTLFTANWYFCALETPLVISIATLLSSPGCSTEVNALNFKHFWQQAQCQYSQTNFVILSIIIFMLQNCD